MAHHFDGPWDSTTINEDGDKDNDGRFEFTIDAGTKKIKAGGKHKDPTTGAETAVTGETEEGDFKRIIIVRGRDVYEGILVPGNGNKLVCGYQRLNAVRFSRSEDDREDETEWAEDRGRSARRFANQEQAIWVATKP